MNSNTIDGKVLRDMGYEPGPAFKEILRWAGRLELRHPDMPLDEKLERLKGEFPPDRVAELNRSAHAHAERPCTPPGDRVVYMPLEELLLQVRESALRKILLQIYKDTKEAAAFLPASIRFHHTEKGGYMRHVTEVANLAVRLFEMLAPPGISRDEVIALSFMHDLSKLESYEFDPDATYRAQRDFLHDSGRLDRHEELNSAARARLTEEDRERLEEIVAFRRKEGIPTSHFGKTLVMMHGYGLKLTDRWIHAIEQHHGPYSDFKTPQVHTLATLIFTADYLSTKLYGHRSSCNYTLSAS